MYFFGTATETLFSTEFPIHAIEFIPFALNLPKIEKT